MIQRYKTCAISTGSGVAISNAVEKDDAGQLVRFSDHTEVIQELVGILRYILNNEDVSIFQSAIEGNGHTVDFEEWEKKARAVVSKADGKRRIPKNMDYQLCTKCGINKASHHIFMAGGESNLCCKCHIAEGGVPADWHKECMDAAAGG
jgi:hypothetical protein